MLVYVPDKSHKTGSPIDPSDAFAAVGAELASALLKLLAAPPLYGTQSASQQKPDDCTTEKWAGLVVDAFFDRICTRFPKPKSQCPFTELNRNQLYELTGGKHSPIRTVSLKEPGERSGARFFFIGDALRHLRALAAEQAANCASPSLSANKKTEHGEHL